ncbi:IS3 family transposase [Methylobacterium nigriterrae]|uniref:IS3 family transposase n=1 Tax=Methylobacterium nigriterrae TaxID=3127512 RepID=UPI003D66C977
MEDFFGSLKTERVHGAQFCTRDEVKAAMFEYIEVRQSTAFAPMLRRPHSS